MFLLRHDRNSFSKFLLKIQVLNSLIYWSFVKCHKPLKRKLTRFQVVNLIQAVWIYSLITSFIFLQTFLSNLTHVSVSWKKFLILLKYLIYNVVPISAVYQSDSVIYIYIYMYIYIYVYIYIHTHTHKYIYMCIFFFVLSSVMVYPMWLDIVPCAIQQDLIAYPL